MDSYLNTSKLPQPPHPFYPLEANIVGYLANKWSVPTLLGIFASGWVVILGSTLAMVRRHNPALPSIDKATILWFVLSEWGKLVPQRRYRGRLADSLID